MTTFSTSAHSGGTQRCLASPEVRETIRGYFDFQICFYSCLLAKDWNDIIDWRDVYIRYFGNPPPRLQDSMRMNRIGPFQRTSDEPWSRGRSWKLMCCVQRFLRLEAGCRALGRTSNEQKPLKGYQGTWVGRLTLSAPAVMKLRPESVEAAEGDDRLRYFESGNAALNGNGVLVAVEFPEFGRTLMAVATYSASCGTVCLPDRPELIGIRVGISLRHLLSIVGANMSALRILECNNFAGPFVVFTLPTILQGFEFLIEGPTYDESAWSHRQADGQPVSSSEQILERQMAGTIVGINCRMREREDSGDGSGEDSDDDSGEDSGDDSGEDSGNDSVE